MAIYQGTPLPRTRGAQSGARRALPPSRVTERPPVPVRMLSRPSTPAHGTSVRVALASEEPAQQVARVRTVAGPRPRTAIAGVALVLVITFVGLFYLSQTFQAAAARYEVAQLGVEREAMLKELQSQAGSTLALGSESTVTQWARDGNLAPLGQRNRVPAR